MPVTIRWSGNDAKTDYYEYGIDSNTASPVNVGMSLSATLTLGGGWHHWNARAANTTCGTAASTWSGDCILCYETQLCSAPQCGETKRCGGNCPDTDSGVPGTPTVDSPWRGGNNNNEFGLPNNWWIES
jgi:hypothetical protein